MQRLRLTAVDGELLGWSKLSGWTKIPLVSANSIGYLDAPTVPASNPGNACATIVGNDNTRPR